MFNAQEGVRVDEAGNQHVSSGHKYYDMHTDYKILASINNELSISNMIAAINNLEIQQELKKMGIYDKTVLSIAKYIKENVINVELHNEYVAEAESKGYLHR